MSQVFDSRGGSIGRARANDMVLPDPSRVVSGRHAHVLLRADRYFVIDTSQNGTYLNDAGEPIGWCKSIEISNGDRLRIGEYQIAVDIAASEWDAPTEEIPPDALAQLRKRWQQDEPAPAETADPDAPTAEIPSDVLAQLRERWGSELELGRHAQQPPGAVVSGADLFDESPTVPARTATETSDDVLVIDDDEEITYFVKFMLERAGHTVAVANDGLSALKFIDDNAPTRLVVLDVVLPHLDGFQVIDAMRANRAWRSVPVIMLSALSGEQDIVRALNSGALDYVVKPFKPTELVARLQRFLPR